MVCVVPLDGGYTIEPENYVYIKPTKGTDVTTLKIPACRGIVIESGYEDSRSIKKHNEFRCHFDTKPAEQTLFKFEQVAKLRQKTNLPIIVRGIMSGVDTMRAVASGASAVWVHSNFEFGPSPISCLRNVVYTLRGNHMMTQVFFSGGVQRGTDVLKAIAIGANAVFLDPETLLWALYEDQDEGVKTLLEMISNELKTAMVLTHCEEVDQITEKQVIHMV